MCSSVGDRTCLLPGFPIRKSSDQSSVDSSPRLIAASYVLHRLLVPRHPPCALNNLATQKTAHPPPEGNDLCGPTQTPATESEDARVHCAVLNVRPATHPHAPAGPRASTGRTSGTRTRQAPNRRNNPTRKPRAGPLPQDPTACLRPDPRPATTFPTRPPEETGRTSSRKTMPANLIGFPPWSPPPPAGRPPKMAPITMWARPW